MSDRLLRRLVDDGLLSLVEDTADGRRRFADLTESGRTEWYLLDDRSNAIAHELLATLDEARQAELIDALQTADRLFRAATVSVEVVEPDIAGGDGDCGKTTNAPSD